MKPPKVQLAKGAEQILFCKHKQMGLNEIIYLQKSSYLLHLLSFASWFLQLQFHWWQSNFRMLRGRTRWPTWRPPLPASLARRTSSEHLSTLNWWWWLYQSIWSIVKEYNICVYSFKIERGGRFVKMDTYHSSKSCNKRTQYKSLFPI